MDGSHIAVIDVGTVSARLLIAQVSGVKVTPVYQDTTITLLGKDLGANFTLQPDRIEAVISTLRRYLQVIAEHHRIHPLDAVVCVCTAATRKATNAASLIEPLAQMGLTPQVIPGDVEARLSFLGVAAAYQNQSLLVADIGGGSTELVVGELQVSDHDVALAFEAVRSFEVGCSVVAELMPSDPPATNDMDGVCGQIAQTIQPFFDADYTRPERLVLIAGTATTLSAIKQGLDPYDQARVHGSELTGGDIAHLVDELAHATCMQRQNVKGLQPKRSHLIVPGALIIEMLMALAGFDSATVSESDMMTGIAIQTARQVRGENLLLAWDVPHSAVCP